MSEVALNRMHLYKARTPPWKDMYRKRCLERLRESRDRQAMLRRCLDPNALGKMEKEACTGHGAPDNIASIMEHEWKCLRGESARQRQRNEEMESDANVLDVPDADLEEVLSLFEDIQKELKAEELRLLSVEDVCDAHLRQEEEELCNAVQQLHTQEVTCPLCEKSNLQHNNGILFCKCGLRINTEQDCISLKNVKDSLHQGTEDHSGQCEGRPLFSLIDTYGITNLIMSCQECDFFFIVV